MLHDFLLEIGCEELPSSAVRLLAERLTHNITAQLTSVGLSFGTVKTFATPRRLAVLISGLITEQPTQHIVKRGPAISAGVTADGSPSPALMGFAKSCGVSVEQLTVQTTDKGSWYVYETQSTGKKTGTLLPELVEQAVKTLAVAKPMRWGRSSIEFARPVHWAVLLLDNEPLKATLFDVKTNNITYGHRFHAPEAIEIPHPLQYESLLEKAFVIADFSKRRELISNGIQAAAQKKNALALMPIELVDEVCSIVEYPVILVAEFAADFLSIPSEALIAAMQSHQKCFALESNEHQLLPYFIIVSNISSKNPAQVIAGNEKVMRARLSDAQFFFNQDKQTPLMERRQKTATVIFQARLGSLLDKANRLATLMAYLSPILNLNHGDAERAAQLSKCDLLSGMVGEFPDLQGLMGYYYALADGESASVAQALWDQYFPRFAGDSLPENPLGLALSLADRIDTLVGIFALGQKPTGDKDPFKLRRHALAIVRLLIAIPERLSLNELIQQSIKAYQQFDVTSADLEQSIHDFIFDRLQSHYHTQSITQDCVMAVRAREESWLADFDSRISALVSFIAEPESRALASAAKRVGNILAKNSLVSLNIDESLLEATAEKSLYQHLAQVEQSSLGSQDYRAILSNLSALRHPVDQFFDEVMVNVDNEAIRMNRLALLNRLQQVMNQVADISCLQIENAAVVIA